MADRAPSPTKTLTLPVFHSCFTPFLSAQGLLEMAEVPKLLYIVVVDEGARGGDEKDSLSFRYTRPVLQSTLQLMGCKARHAFKGDVKFAEVLEKMGAKVTWTENSVTVTGPPRDPSKRKTCVPDVAMTLAVVALFADGPTAIRDGRSQYRSTIQSHSSTIQH